MLFTFDLGVDDYVAASLLRRNSLAGVARLFAKPAITLLLCFLVLVLFGEGRIPESALRFAAVFTAAYFSYQVLTWRARVRRRVRGHYEDSRYRAILGPHTLETTDSGLHSCGPLHRTFRAWAAILAVVSTSTHVFFETAFGVVYVLPKRAITDEDALYSQVASHTGIPVERAT